MHSILNVYYNYAVEKGGQTLLPQYLAMYKITVRYTLYIITNFLLHIFIILRACRKRYFREWVTSSFEHSPGEYLKSVTE